MHEEAKIPSRSGGSALGTETRTFSEAQRLAITRDGRDLLVAAGAGTGKTTVLVERVLRKLRGGTSLDSLLVVTFTEKAAAEMKERIHRALSRDPGLRRLLPLLPRAGISTIHAFCARLLREHFLLAGVDAGFRVLDENGAREAMEEALRRTFHDWYVRGDEEGRTFQDLVELAGFGEHGEELREIVQRLHAFARSTPDPSAYLDGLAQRSDPANVAEAPWSEDWIHAFSREWRHALSLYAEVVRLAEASGVNAKPQDALFQALSTFDPATLRDGACRAAFLTFLRTEGHLNEGDGFDLDFPRAPKGANQIPGWESLHKQAKVIFDNSRIFRWLAVSDAALLYGESHQNRSLRVLVALVREMDAAYARYKDRNGFLDYSDLEVRTAQLLRAHASDLALQDRYSEVLVDEYQDVNPLQESILGAVSKPGRRFRVGDVKQSIYRFRLADPRIFLRHVATGEVLSGTEMREGSEEQGASFASEASGRVETGEVSGRRETGEVSDRPQLTLDLDSLPRPAPRDEEPRRPGVIYLNDNHRSRPEVLHFVNTVFGSVFDESTIGSRYEDQALVAKRDSAGSSHPVELHWIELSGAREKSNEESAEEPEIDLRELQPRVVARRLRNLRNDPVLIGQDGECDWSRVVILLRARTAAQRYRDALVREGIPCVLGEGGSLLEEPGARDLLNLLRVIDNPRDDIALASVLRSPLFAITDPDLLRIRIAFPAARTYLDAAIGAAELGRSPNSEWIDAFIPSQEGTLPAWIGEPRPAADEVIPSALRDRLAAVFARIAAWRSRAELVELGRLLVDLLEETHLHTMTKGDAQQDACLEKLVALARAYDAERGPSLRGFLARLDALEAAGGIDSVAAQTSGNGVRVLTIHRAKGLEFPVVVLPELGWRFYGKDRLASRIRIGPEYVGLRRFDPELHLRIDSIGRSVLEQIQEDERREEEARVLYVAFTRACEKLVLVGASTRKLGGGETEVQRRVRSARAFEYLQWVESALPWGEGRPVGTAVLGESGEDVADGLEAIEFPSLSLLVTQIQKRWIAARAADPRAAEVSQVTATKSERDSDFGETLWKRISQVPPRPALSLVPTLRGKYWVTELGRSDDVSWFEEMRENATAIGVPGEASTRNEPGDAPSIPTRRDSRTSGVETASEVGIRYHMALSRVDLGAIRSRENRDVGPADEPCTAVEPEGTSVSDGVTRAFRVLAAEPWWGQSRREPVLEAGLARFLDSPLGERLQRAARSEMLEREVAFSLRWPVLDLLTKRPDLVSLDDLDPRWDQSVWRSVLADAWVLIQGRIDCVFEESNGGRRWVVIDWKTDRVLPQEVSAHAERYRTQMEMYAEAARRLWGSPVETHLVYLWPGVSVGLF